MDFAQRIPAQGLAKLLAAAGLTATLAACGGGAGSGEGPELADRKFVTIKGTAALGAAMINRPISVVCKLGSGAAASDDKGNFSAVVEEAVGPCVLTTTAPGTGGAVLRSIAKGDGTVSNITPLTELLTRYVAIQAGLDNTTGIGTPPFAIATSPKVANLLNTSTTYGNSVNRLISAIKTGAGASAASLAIPTDFLTANLVAKSATVAVGNEQDQVLDRMRALNMVTALGEPSTAITNAVAADAKANPLN